MRACALALLTAVGVLGLAAAGREPLQIAPAKFVETGNLRLGADTVPLRAEWTGNIGPIAIARALTLCDEGRFLAGGYFGAADLDPSMGNAPHTSVGESQDGFVIALGSDGRLGWAYTVGGVGWDAVEGVGVAADGGVIAAGTFAGTVDFDPTEGVDERTAVGDYNAFVVWLAPDGAYERVVTFGQGNDSVGAGGLAVDNDGSIIVVGGFFGTADFDPGPGEDLRTSTPIYGWSSRDIFVTKLAPDGSYLWTETSGGSGWDNGTDVAVDADGNVFITGTFRGTVDFDPGPGVDPHTAIGVDNAFVTKLHPDGSYAWTRSYPRAKYEEGQGEIAVDGDGAAYITGFFWGTVDFDPTGGVDLRTSTDGSPDIFLTKLEADGSYGWTYTAGAADGGDCGHGVATGPTGDVVLTGGFGGAVDFDPGLAQDVHVSTGNTDVFVTVFEGDGAYRWTRTFGGDPTDLDFGEHIGVDTSGAILVSGISWMHGPLDMDPSCEVAALTPHDPGSADTFFAKLVAFEPTADANGNGAVDLRDWAAVQGCFTGEGPADCGQGCNALDLDADSDIDHTDYAEWRTRLTGP